jgi:hypothetical protein
MQPLLSKLSAREWDGLTPIFMDRAPSAMATYFLR